MLQPNNEVSFEPNTKSPPEADSPLAKNKLLLIIIICVLSSATVVGLAVYFVMAKSANREQVKLEQQVQALEQQINELKSNNVLLPDQNQIQSQENKPTEQNNETADWQTYRNEKYGYEVKYPNDFIVNQTDPNTISIGSQVMPYIVIEKYPSNSKYNFQNYPGDFQTYAKEKLVEDFKRVLIDNNTIKWSSREVAGQPTLDAEFENMAGGYTGNVVWTFILKGNEVYRISAFQGYNKMSQPQFQNQILSTFKFLE